MIEVTTKIHDKFALEFKLGFVADEKSRKSDFSANMWLFFPKSLDINPNTYTKANFYQDIKSNVRLITPKYPLGEIVHGDAQPLGYLRKAFSHLATEPSDATLDEFEYQIKMFSAIVKSAARDAVRRIGASPAEDVEMLCHEYVQQTTDILREYSASKDIITGKSVPVSALEYFSYGDDYISNIIRYYGIKLLKIKDSDEIHESLKAIFAYREEREYPNLIPGEKQANRDTVHRHSILKKYIESDMFLSIPKKKDGLLLEQIYFSIAAGLAMVFATVVSFFFQQKFGNFTLPFFIILVISYMIKDRIKELSRFYFAHKIGSKFHDNKASILIKGKKIGTYKEAVDFIHHSKIPENIRRVRYAKRLHAVENRIMDEKTLLYRMSVHIDNQKLAQTSIYENTGINDIIRLHLNHFMQKMDNPVVNIASANRDGIVEEIPCTRLYFMNIILQTSEDCTSFRRFRVALTRDGIDSIEEIV